MYSISLCFVFACSGVVGLCGLSLCVFSLLPWFSWVVWLNSFCCAIRRGVDVHVYAGWTIHDTFLLKNTTYTLCLTYHQTDFVFTIRDLKIKLRSTAHVIYMEYIEMFPCSKTKYSPYLVYQNLYRLS